jgi:hypothetical protein
MPTLKIECRSCGGTGLYRGSSEWGDCAVVCMHCSGTGGVIYGYEQFEGRRPAEHVKRVFKAVAGAKHTHKDAEGIRFSRAGCSYSSWIKGAEPLPVRELYCPLRWTGQLLRDKLHHAHAMWEEMCSDHIFGERIDKCPRHTDPDKLAACWRRFDDLMTKGEKR